jgi:hypothetical protein
MKMMPQRHVWGWYPPQTALDIHIWHIQSVWAIGMRSQGHMDAPLYRYTVQVGPRFGDSDSLEEWKWCHNIMVEADIHLRLLYTSIVEVFKVFETLVCCLKGIWMHPCIIIPARPQILEFGSFLEWKMLSLCDGWGWHPPQTASHIHIWHIKCVTGIDLLSQGHMGAPLYCYTS